MEIQTVDGVHLVSAVSLWLLRSRVPVCVEDCQAGPYGPFNFTAQNYHTADFLFHKNPREKAVLRGQMLFEPSENTLKYNNIQVKK